MGNVLISRRAFLGGTGGGGGGTLPSDYESLEYIICGSGSNHQSGFSIYNYKPQSGDYFLMTTSPSSSTSEQAFFGYDGAYEGYYQQDETKAYGYISKISSSRTVVGGVIKDETIYSFTQTSNTNPQIGYYRANSYRFDGKIHYAKAYQEILDSTGTATGNFRTLVELVPCKRKSDDVVGMFDLVYQIFYLSTVGDPFTAPSNP